MYSLQKEDIAMEDKIEEIVYLYDEYSDHSDYHYDGTNDDYHYDCTNDDGHEDFNKEKFTEAIQQLIDTAVEKAYQEGYVAGCMYTLAQLKQHLEALIIQTCEEARIEAYELLRWKYKELNHQTVSLEFLEAYNTLMEEAQRTKLTKIKGEK